MSGHSGRAGKAMTLCLVGAGNMGGAMLRGWLEAGTDPALITVLDPSPPPAMSDMLKSYSVRHVTEAAHVGVVDFVLVAVKPQIIAAVLKDLGPLIGPETVLASVAAGTLIAQLEVPFAGTASRIIRVMPNTPALIGQAISVCVANEGVTPQQRKTVTGLLEAIGDVAWVEDEALIDAVTGVSGSGPAYVFYLAEALAAAGEAAGLPAALASQLAVATVAGAGNLLKQSDEDAATLRSNVTSPNGTTQAALEVLMADDGLGPLMKEAVAAATNRSKELAG
ncbi:MAG: pyrroline-5-carboxylate reductase [Pseudomonadota bacterium]